MADQSTLYKGVFQQSNVAVPIDWGSFKGVSGSFRGGWAWYRFRVAMVIWEFYIFCCGGSVLRVFLYGILFCFGFYIRALVFLEIPKGVLGPSGP